LEKCHKPLELLEDIIGQGEDIFHFIVQALHEYRAFFRVIPLDFGNIILKFYVIGKKSRN
jgi:hypothetical protein